MKPYILVRDWVDACLAGPRALSVADVPLWLPILLAGVLTFSLSRATATIIVFGATAFAWAVFVIWRGWRLGRAEAFKRDRDDKGANQ